MVLAREGKALSVVEVPYRVLDGYALARSCGRREALDALLGPEQVVDRGEVSLAYADRVVSALARETGGDGVEALSLERGRVKRGGTFAWFDGLAGTEHLSRWALGAKVWYHYNLDTIVPVSVDWDREEPYLKAWFASALEAGRRRR